MGSKHSAPRKFEVSLSAFSMNSAVSIPLAGAGTWQTGTNITGDNGAAPAVKGIGNLATVGVDPTTFSGLSYYFFRRVYRESEQWLLGDESSQEHCLSGSILKLI